MAGVTHTEAPHRGEPSCPCDCAVRGVSSMSLVAAVLGLSNEGDEASLRGSVGSARVAELGAVCALMWGGGVARLAEAAAVVRSVSEGSGEEGTEVMAVNVAFVGGLVGAAAAAVAVVGAAATAAAAAVAVDAASGCAAVGASASVCGAVCVGGCMNGGAAVGAASVGGAACRGGCVDVGAEARGTTTVA